MRAVLKYGLLLIVLLGCNHNADKQDYDSQYDIEVLYNYYQTDSSYKRDYLNQRYLRDGKLYLIFEDEFRNDTVDIYVNNKIHSTDILNTNDSEGVAKSYDFDDINDVDMIGIRINGGKMALIEIDTMNFILIDFHIKKLRIRMVENVPTYE